MLSSSWARACRAAISTISATQDASRMPGADTDSGPDTSVLRIEHVGAHDLELGDLVVNGRCADHPLTQAPAAARHQRQTHPAIELDRGGRRGHVAETRGARLRRDQLQAVAQAVPALEGPYPDELQPIRRREAGALRQRAADEIAVLLQHPLKAEIIGAGVAVELRSRHVALLDAQGVERLEAVGRYTQGLACLEHRRPRLQGVSGRYRQFVGQLARERD